MKAGTKKSTNEDGTKSRGWLWHGSLERDKAEVLEYWNIGVLEKTEIPSSLFLPRLHCSITPVLGLINHPGHQ
jgi:hypothetical protein